jgi:hypothetical protein
LCAPRLASLWRRRALAGERNDAFVGFRSCALAEGDTAHEETANVAADPADIGGETIAAKPARTRAPRRAKATDAPAPDLLAPAPTMATPDGPPPQDLQE